MWGRITRSRMNHFVLLAPAISCNDGIKCMIQDQNRNRRPLDLKTNIATNRWFTYVVAILDLLSLRFVCASIKEGVALPLGAVRSP